MKLLRTSCIMLLFFNAVEAASKVSCNERALHGRLGAVKGVIAIGGGIALHHIIKETWECSKPLRTGYDTFQMRKKEDAEWQTICMSLALLLLGYTAYTFLTESVESLNIFFDDDEKEAKKDTP